MPVAVTPKGHATRAFILQTAAELFAERGYTDATMAELITRTGLTKGAFYFHFTSKEQLALAVLQAKQVEWLELASRRVLGQTKAVDQLLALGPAIVELHREDPSAYSASRLMRELGRTPALVDHVRGHMRAWIDMVAEIIKRAQQDGDLPSDLDATTLATVLVAATDGLKDLSDILDSPKRARSGFERRMQSLVDIVQRLVISADD